jgi:hypothetical protein
VAILRNEGSELLAVFFNEFRLLGEFHVQHNESALGAILYNEPSMDDRNVGDGIGNPDSFGPRFVFDGDLHEISAAARIDFRDLLKLLNGFFQRKSEVDSFADSLEVFRTEKLLNRALNESPACQDASVWSCSDDASSGLRIDIGNQG